jgi:ABC-type oligopeptide transport system ATPase subunit
MVKEVKPINWHIVHSLICDALISRYPDDASAGAELYQDLVGEAGSQYHKDFSELNSWVKKFGLESGTKSFDPFHILASFNSGKLSDQNRRNRIDLLYRLLEVPEQSRIPVSEINFDGCPTPIAIDLLSNRSQLHMIEIWSLMRRVRTEAISTEQGHSSWKLRKNVFDQHKEWHGIGFASFSICLFWINSSGFIPMDKHTTQFLQSSKLARNLPTDYSSYKKLVGLFEKRNTNYGDSNFGETGLFREIAYYAYTLSFGHDPEPEWMSSSLKSVLRAPYVAKDYIKHLKELSNYPKSFKLIAIEPLTGCDKQHLNILVPEQRYFFEQGYTISEKKGKSTLQYDPKKNRNIYNIQRTDRDVLSVNVTAIVGENGCGKSSLLELFFRMVNNVAWVSQDTNSSSHEVKWLDDLNARLFYQQNDRFWELRLVGKKITIADYGFPENKEKFEGNNEFENELWKHEQFTKKHFTDFFYTVAVNYSLYSLNSEILGPWVQKLFHKNDGYQIPLVINPMRTDGNIDVNREDRLLNQRLLANLFVVEDETGNTKKEIAAERKLQFRQISEKHRVEKVIFSFDYKEDKATEFYCAVGHHKYEALKYSDLKTRKREFLDEVKKLKVFVTDGKNPQWVAAAEDYLFKKAVRIAATCSHFAPRITKAKVVSKKLAKDLEDDHSHVSYKYRQALNYLRHPVYADAALEYEETGKDDFALDVAAYSQVLDNYKSQLDAASISELLPPPIFSSKIILEDGTPMDRLSSGEKQLLHAVSSIVYHLRNLDSVADGLVKYRNINIMLDEIELYFHPELQRTYLTYLRHTIGKLNLDYITAINICMVTHSPFILSDIPHHNMLKLGEGGKPKVEQEGEEEKTFGANIHDLLNNSFFMKSTVGGYAEKKVKEFLRFYHQVSAEDQEEDELKAEFRRKEIEFRYIVSEFGDDVIRAVLQNHLDYLTNHFAGDASELDTNGNTSSDA